MKGLDFLYSIDQQRFSTLCNQNYGRMIPET
jgi:hypothetical protein